MHAGPGHFGDTPGRSTETRSDVQNPVGRAQVHRADRAIYGLQATDVVLVQKIELLGCQGAGEVMLGEQSVHRLLNSLFSVGHCRLSLSMKKRSPAEQCGEK